MSSMITPAKLCIFFALSLTSLFAEGAPKVGDTFPIAKTAELEGDFPKGEGKIMLVDFWASWCVPCRLAFPELDKLHTEYAGKGFLVVGVSVDDRESDMQKFLTRQPVGFQVVRDAKKALVSSLQVKAMPTTYLVDRKGTIRYIHSGFHGQETVDALRKQISLLLEEPKE